MAFVKVFTHSGILRRRAAGNLPAGIEKEELVAKEKRRQQKSERMKQWWAEKRQQSKQTF
ncbi:MAG: hypothetical protein JO235_13035 [Chroococcidiopsidaceae cyanobacterium CP_BM_RX_35]|nr:hypothetical protein [Chroococcidiopsidaceae cyanobacterium CP_BM_RX_35]